jgi:hypothetical protein
MADDGNNTSENTGDLGPFEPTPQESQQIGQIILAGFGAGLKRRLYRFLLLSAWLFVALPLIFTAYLPFHVDEQSFFFLLLVETFGALTTFVIFNVLMMRSTEEKSDAFFWLVICVAIGLVASVKTGPLRHLLLEFAASGALAVVLDKGFKGILEGLRRRIIEKENERVELSERLAKATEEYQARVKALIDKVGTDAGPA